MGEQRTASSKPSARSEGMRVIRYVLIGLVVAGTHFTAAWLALAAGAWPGAANAFGYVIGFCVSYWGQSRFTFGLKQGSKAMLGRWALTQISLLVTSSFAVQAVTSLFGAPPVAVLGAAIIIIAALGYLIGRAWVFRPGASGG